MVNYNGSVETDEKGRVDPAKMPAERVKWLAGLQDCDLVALTCGERHRLRVMEIGGFGDEVWGESGEPNTMLFSRLTGYVTPMIQCGFCRGIWRIHPATNEQIANYLRGLIKRRRWSREKSETIFAVAHQLGLR